MGERFRSPCEPPEGYVRELLVILSEEASEVAQRVCKALRFGLQEIQPGQNLTNAQRIAEEIGDLLAVFDRLHARGLLDANVVTNASIAKEQKLDRFLQSEPDA